MFFLDIFMVPLDRQSIYNKQYMECLSMFLVNIIEPLDSDVPDQNQPHEE